MKSKRSRHESTSAESEVSDDSEPSVDESSDSEESNDSSVDVKRSKKKKKQPSSSASESEDDDAHHRRSAKKRKHKKKKGKHSKKKRKESSEEESDSVEEPSSESEQEEVEEEEPPAKRKHKHKHKSKHSKKGSVRSENYGKHKSRHEEYHSQEKPTERDSSKYHRKEQNTHDSHTAGQVENISSSEDEKNTASATHIHREFYDHQYPNRSTSHREHESSRYRDEARHRTTESETQQVNNRDRNRHSEHRPSYTRDRDRETSAPYQQVDRYQHKYPERQYEYDHPPPSEYQRASEYPEPGARVFEDRDNNSVHRSRQDRFDPPRFQDIPRLLDVEIPRDLAFNARARPEYNLDTDYQTRNNRAQDYNENKLDGRRADRPRDRDRLRRKPRSPESTHRNDREQKHSDHKVHKQERVRDELRPESRSHRGNEQRSNRTSRPLRTNQGSRNRDEFEPEMQSERDRGNEQRNKHISRTIQSNRNREQFEPEMQPDRGNEQRNKHISRTTQGDRNRDEFEPEIQSERDNEHRNNRIKPRDSRPAAADHPQVKRETRHESRSPRRPAAREVKKERDRSPRKKRNEEESKNYDWGKKTEEKEKKPVEGKEKPNFGLSGKLAEDTNTVNGVVLKYTEPDDAKQPKRKWRFYPFKGEQALPILYIHRQSAFLLGRDKMVADIPLDHPSISKQHAALQYRSVPFKRDDGTNGKRIRPYIIDLESANGTFVNNKKIDSRKYVELLERDVVKFGFSQREYVLLHENSKDDACDDDLMN